MVADAQADQAAATTPAPAEPAQVNPPPAREVGSLQKLALVMFGIHMFGSLGATFPIDSYSEAGQSNLRE